MTVVRPEATRQRSLAHRVARWVALSTGASLLVFSALAYVVVVLDEGAEPERDAPEEIAREAREQVGYAMLVAGPICLVLAVAGASVFTRRMLRPLDHVIRSAAQITPQGLNQRLPIPAERDEVHAAVLALNDLLQRLESGFKALDRFASDASHELRTPLAVIGTELEVMLHGTRSSLEWENSARTCLDEVHHLSRLVDALLGMARADSGADVKRAEVDVQAVIEEVVAVLGARARERGVQLRAAIGLESQRTVVVGDADALASALSNIVHNAICYTPPEGEVLVSLSREPGRLLVHVDDTGPGVAEDERDRIFEPFRRGAAAREDDRGLGLGLTIARSICDNHDATLGIARSPYGGARFSIAFRSMATTLE